VLGSEKQRTATLAGLESARGVLQAKINRELSLRRTPTLAFAYDDSVERGVRMTKLIEDVARDLPSDSQGADDREPGNRDSDQD